MVKIFSLHGRAKRLEWWIINISWLLLMALLGGALKHEIIPEWIPIVTFWLTIWIVFAVQVKRWHDRNKSGIWCFINLIPIIGNCWALIELGILPGKPEANEYDECENRPVDSVDPV